MEKDIEIDLKKTLEIIGKFIILCISVYEMIGGILVRNGHMALIGIIGIATWMLLIHIEELEGQIRDRDDLIVKYYIELEQIRSERGERE